MGPIRKLFATPTHKQILFDVSASFHPGELVALMGPSGAGMSHAFVMISFLYMLLLLLLLLLLMLLMLLNLYVTSINIQTRKTILTDLICYFARARN